MLNPGSEEPKGQARRLRLPKITPLHFLTLRLLFEGQKSGHQLRQELAARGVAMGRSAFSQVIRRMEWARLVRGDDASQTRSGRAIRYRVYRATTAGLRAWRRARRFYASMALPADTKAHLFSEEERRREDEEFREEFLRLTMQLVDQECRPKGGRRRR